MVKNPVPVRPNHVRIFCKGSDMQTDVAQEIFNKVSVLPESKQRAILEQIEKLAEEGRPVSIWDRILAHSKEIPDEVWEQMPVDGSEQHDHYIYGSPKR